MSQERYKPMTYEGTPMFLEILYEGEYLGYNFRVVSFGAWPCAYVRIPKGHPLYGVDYDKINDENVVAVHGGFTYSRRQEGELPGWWIGWDYCHHGDYNGLLSRSRGKKWTTEEMVNECKLAISDLHTFYEEADYA